MADFEALETRSGLLESLKQALGEALLRSTPGAMSTEEAASAAEQVAVGGGLPEGVVQRLGRAPALTLVSFDADRIQSWVFASERVQVSAGASKVLDDLNRAIREGEIVRDLRSRNRGAGPQGVLYSAGGGGLLVADTALDEEVLERQVHEWLRARSEGLSFTVKALRLSARDLAATSPATALDEPGEPLGRFELLDGLSGALVRIQVAVRQAKEEHPWAPPRAAFDPRTGEALERCPSCGRRPPGERDVIPGERWCSQCERLRRYWKRDVQAGFERDGRPLTFEDLAGASRRGRGYLGFIAIDGNSMGAVVQGVRTLLELRAFSEATSWVYSRARQRVRAVLEPFLVEGWPAEEGCLSLLSGGDEITLVLPAAAGPMATVAALRAIEEGYDEATAPGGLLAEAFEGNPVQLDALRRAGAAGGLIAAQSSFPVRLLRRYAGELQKQAKRACSARGLRSGLSWLLLTDSSPLPEGVASEGPEEDLSVGAFERRLAEVAAAEAPDVRLPRSALQRLVEHWRSEEDGINTLGPAQRREVGPALMANFFRYQLVRNRRLEAWWQSIAETPGEPGDDPVARWLREGGLDRLERLSQLWSLAPVPPPETGSLEEAGS